jgi:hypothetical protein
MRGKGSRESSTLPTDSGPVSPPTIEDSPTSPPKRETPYTATDSRPHPTENAGKWKGKTRDKIAVRKYFGSGGPDVDRGRFAICWLSVLIVEDSLSVGAGNVPA